MYWDIAPLEVLLPNYKKIFTWESLWFYVSSLIRHSQGFLTTGMLHIEAGYPFLTCKAWNGKILLLFLDLCMEVLHQQKPGDTEISLAFLCSRSLVCWFDRLSRYGRYLTPAEGAEIANFGHRFLKLYQRLAYHGVTHKLNRWKLLPKLHPFKHACEDMQSKLYNYRFVHTYKDEDFVGVMKKLCERVSKGDLCEYRILTRFLLRLSTWVPSK